MPFAFTTAKVFNPRWIIGRTIVAVELRPFKTESGQKGHDPLITLDDGAKLAFMGCDLDDDQQSVELLYIPAPKQD